MILKEDETDIWYLLKAITHKQNIAHHFYVASFAFRPDQ